jgi:aldose sugar dehydrogenase
VRVRVTWWCTALSHWLAVGWLSLAASLVSAQTVKDPLLQVTEIVGGLNAPTAMAFIGDLDILVLQKSDGQVRRVVNGVLQPTPALDVAVNQLSERGLLGIAVHPMFPSTPWVYLYYTESSTADDTMGLPESSGNRLYRYRWDGNALVEPTLLLDLPVIPGPNHDGGVLRFGPDGKLYVVIGDLNHHGQLQNIPAGEAPDDTSVIIRLNDDGTIPSDNPFFALGGNLAKYYAYGIRNSFGMAFDPLTNKLWMTENGPDTFDEINLVEPGFNSGWSQIMGPDAHSPQGADNLFRLPNSHYADPLFSWFATVAPTAIVFLNSGEFGEQYQQDIFVGDINSGTLYRFKPTPARDGMLLQSAGLTDLVADPEDDQQEITFGSGFGGITDLKVGSDGRLYVVSFQGKIFAVSRAAVTLQGMVKDAISGAALQGVGVTGWRVSPAPVVRANARTDASGIYALHGLNPGRYWLFFHGSGYHLSARHIELPPGGTIPLDVQLSPRGAEWGGESLRRRNDHKSGAVPLWRGD